VVPQSLKKRAAELERQVKEYAENVKRVLREYRETQRASARVEQAPPSRIRARLLRKRRDVERANAEYMALQKELDMIRSRMQARK
jgi:prefoldin subunit 5